MPVIESTLDANSAEFAKNCETMRAAIASFRDVEQLVLNKAFDAKAKFDNMPNSVLKQWKEAYDA